MNKLTITIRPNGTNTMQFEMPLPLEFNEETQLGLLSWLVRQMNSAWGRDYLLEIMGWEVPISVGDTVSFQWESGTAYWVYSRYGWMKEAKP